MLGLGLAASHAPSMFRPVELWPAIHGALTSGVSQPAGLERETPEVLREYHARIEKGFGVLKDRLKAYRPDALLIVGDDQGEVFSPKNMPDFCIFTVPEVRGTTNVALIGEPETENHVTIRCHRELAVHVVDELTRSGFKISRRDEVRPEGRPARGIGHAFTRPYMKVAPGFDLPVVDLHVNAYFAPMPTARRCYDLGRAIAGILERRPERVAIMASGGLSHDPRGPRAGWIDTVLDRWVLDQIGSGNGEALCNLFTFGSDTLDGGTGEIRSWIVVAGACAGAKARIVDYIPAHHAVTGLGFAYWPAEEVEGARRSPAPMPHQEDRGKPR